MPREVIIYPDDRLRKKIEYNSSLDPVDVIEELYATIEAEKAKHTWEPIGLAATQIGIETRILLFLDRDNQMKPLVNPVIRGRGTPKRMGPWIENEGCGSIPGLVVPVLRNRLVSVHADNLNLPITFFNWPARIIQHEIDHLDGILILDREFDEQG